MISSRRSLVLFTLVFCLGLDLGGNGTSSSQAAQWSIPLAGNAYRSSPKSGGFDVRGEALLWNDSSDVYSIYFRVDRATDLQLSILSRSTSGRCTLTARVNGHVFDLQVEGNQFRDYKVGTIHVNEAGYCRVDLSGQRETGDFSVEVKDLVVVSPTEGLTVDFVKSNQGQMYYWGRRGPSVHLRYRVPKALPIEFAYSEITVPQGLDPIGSYFMANGFAEGYFGIQVNSDQERRVLFSVWSPFKTDDPSEVPEEQRIVSLAYGAEVQIGEFGNEGTGGQSYLKFPWKSEVTYRFLTQVKPDENGNTVYASWFSEADAKSWRLIARFSRPQTNTYLKGFHSFLENFDPTRGHFERRALYGNQWVRDTEGQWHECTSAHFSVDATGGGRHRLDFSGGADADGFYLRNCGFFCEPVAAGAEFERDSNSHRKPEIDIEMLP